MTAFAETKAFETGATPLHSEILINVAGITSSASTRRLKAGETLYVEGETSTYCYEVVDGLMKEYNTLEDGRRQVAEFYGAGELFGVSEASGNLHTAEAITDCIVRCYPKDAYLREIAASPALSRRFLDTILTRLHRARERMIILGRMSAAQRVAAFLLRLSTDQQTTRDVTFLMSRQDIADHLGLTIETVCRMLTMFKKSRMIEMKNARLFNIVDQSALESAASCSILPNQRTGARINASYS